MNGNEVLRVVDAIHRDKNIAKETVFEGIEQAILSAARKHYGEEIALEIHIDRVSGEPQLLKDGEAVDQDTLGRVAAQTAKQVMIQKIREAERDAQYEEYVAMQGQLVVGTVTSCVNGMATVNLGRVEAVLPRSEQIPGESHRPGERVRAVILEVRKVGSRVKIVLSRTHTDFVRRLFEIEIPEIAERVIEIRSLAREAGYRSKVAVSCIDLKVDCVGACVGVRGARIKNIVDELAGERIDIVRWNDSLQVLVPNALQPAEVDDVILCPMLGRVIVLVREDQLSLAIGKRGQNVRLASKLVGWDIEIMTREELDEQLESSIAAFSQIPGASEELAENLVAQGYFSFDDLSCIEPDQLAELGELTPEECDQIIAYADEESARLEAMGEEEKRRRSELRMAAAAAGKEEQGAEAAAAEESEADAGSETGVGVDSEAAAAEDAAPPEMGDGAIAEAGGEPGSAESTDPDTEIDADDEPAVQGLGKDDGSGENAGE